MIKPLLLVTIATLSTVALAHPPVEKHAERISKILELDETRSAALQEALNQIRNEAETMRDKHQDERISMRERRRDILSEVLSEDEIEKLENMMEKRRNKSHRREEFM
jgi:hypothetical protein